MMSGRGVASVRGVALAAAVLVLAGLAAADAGLGGTALRQALPLALRAALLATGLALAAVALGDGMPRAPLDWTRGERWAVVALTAVAFAVRAWHLDALRVLIDEGNSIDNLLRAHDPATSLLLPPSIYVTTMLHPAWQALVVAVAGPTLQAFRLSSALLGALTVPALWLLARALFDRPTALAAAILLAGFAPHVHFSRVGLPHIGDALFGTLALAGVACGLAGGGRSAWALGGVALGLTHYGFEAGRWFFTPLVVAWLGVQAMLAPARLRAARAGVATLALACALTLLPLYGAALAGGAGLAPRLRTSALDGGAAAALLSDPPALRARLALAAGVLLWEPERADYYGGDEALLTPLLAPFAILGMAVCAGRPRAPAVLIPLWLLAAWLANVAMRDPAVYARWVIVLPALSLATARGIGVIPGWLRGAADRRFELAAVALAALLASLSVYRYFGSHLARLAQQAVAAKPYRDGVDAALRAAAVMRRGDVLVISDPPVDVHPPRSLLRLLRDGRDDLGYDVAAPARLDAAFLAALPADRDHVFFVAPGDADSVARLSQCFALAGPRPSAYPLPPDKALDLYLAPVGSRRADCETGEE